MPEGLFSGFGQLEDMPIIIRCACKQIAIATARLKIAGARWTLSGAIATAKARAV